MEGYCGGLENNQGVCTGVYYVIRVTRAGYFSRNHDGKDQECIEPHDG